LKRGAERYGFYVAVFVIHLLPESKHARARAHTHTHTHEIKHTDPIRQCKLVDGV